MPLSRREFVATLVAATAAHLPETAGASARPAADEDIDALRALFANPPEAARPMTRWWWFGGAVTPEEITRELTSMKEAGLRGAEIQPVYPVAADDARRGVRNLRYYSDEWFAALRHAVREAKRLSLQLDFTLGSGWPYGGPFVPTSLAARRLRLLSEDVLGPRDFAWDVTPLLTGDDRPLGVVAAPLLPDLSLDLSRSQVLTGQPRSEQRNNVGHAFVRFQAPAGPWRLMLLLDSPTGQLVKRPTLGMEGYVLDHHSKEAMELFLRAAGDRVIDGVEGEADPPFHSVFCDSLEVYGADWTGRLLEEFRRRRGYDLLPKLPALFSDSGAETPHVRYDYHLTLSELNLDYFFRPLVAWAERRGMRARIQAHGAPCDVIQAYGLAHIPEGENIFLGDRYQVNLRHRRLASSAAHLYSKPLASSETYTWLRTPLFTTPLERMKPATDSVLLDGLNHVVNHGYSYSPPAAGEPGWYFYASTEANHANTWWRHYPHLARYVRHACALLQRGVQRNPVGVYFAAADLFAKYGSGGLHVDVEAEGQIDAALLAGLRQGGYDFDMLNDHALEHLARVEAGRLVAGTGRYDVMIVPAARLMPAASAARLLEFASAGGHLIFLERLPEAAPGLPDAAAKNAALQRSLAALWSGHTPAPGATASVGRGSVALAPDTAAALQRLRAVLHPDFEIVAAGDGGASARKAAVENVGFLHRHQAGTDYYFVANVSEHDHDLRVHFDSGHRRPERWNPESGRTDSSLVYEHVAADGRPLTEVALELEPFESCFVVFGSATDAPLVTRSDWRGPLSIRRDGPSVVVSGRIARNGAHTLTLGSGFTHRFSIADLPAAATVDGPWTLALGPATPVELALLRSWNELPAGRHFSGWGRYETTFEAPPLRDDLEWTLDLGVVHETAEVILNDRPLGAAWKGWRRVACGEALRPGRNRLRVDVANLWIHAMAAREPPPQWKDVEETFGIRWGRYGEVKPDALPPSGLLGPVRLLPAKRHTVRL